MKTTMKMKMMDPLGWTPIPCKHPDTPAAVVDTTSLLSWCQAGTSAPCLGRALPLGHLKYCAHLRSPPCPRHAPVSAGGGSRDLGAGGCSPGAGEPGAGSLRAAEPSCTLTSRTLPGATSKRGSLGTRQPRGSDSPGRLERQWLQGEARSPASSQGLRWGRSSAAAPPQPGQVSCLQSQSALPCVRQRPSTDLELLFYLRALGRNGEIWGDLRSAPGCSCLGAAACRDGARL